MPTTAPLSTPKRWKRFFAKVGRLIWRVLRYLLVLAITAGVIILLLCTLLTILGLPSEIVRTAPYTFAALVRGMLDEVRTLAVVLLGTRICLQFLDKRDMASLGFSFRQNWLPNIGIGLLLGAGLTGIMFVVEVLCGWIDVQGFAWNTRPPDRVAFDLCMAVVHTTVVAVAEETWMRGYLLQALEEGFGIRAAVIVSSFVFSLPHLCDPTAIRWARYVIPFTFTLGGVMFAMAYLTHRSLWLPIGLHFAWNTFVHHIFGLTGAPAQRATFFVTEVTGPAFWVGLPNSTFGPGVGMLGVLATLLGMGLICYFWRRQQLA
jgi:membrane protease YdiL (CAAX protease family)